MMPAVFHWMASKSLSLDRIGTPVSIGDKIGMAPHWNSMNDRNRPNAINRGVVRIGSLYGC
ncbi:hypothetical protein FHR71_005263 [Methylobacterium sp. RAS18]|nr:hypothetical protein [Methylobacterium sp. RAS18]